MTEQEFLALAPDKPWHARRWSMSAKWVKSNVGKDCRTWEAGGMSPFTGAVDRYATRIEIPPFDLRYPCPWGPQFFGKVDCILAMEVIEHVSDQNTSDINTAAQFNGSGVRQFFATCGQLLRPGGLLYLTTPNICSAASIVQAIDGRHPHVFEPHHREYTAQQIFRLLEDAGFVLRTHRTIDSYHRSQEAHARLEQMPGANRGDTHEISAVRAR